MTSSQWEQLLSILRPHLRFLPADQPVDPDADLAELGLDSMASIKLLLDLEQGFGVTVPDEALDENTFASARQLERLVGGLLAAG